MEFLHAMPGLFLRLLHRAHRHSLFIFQTQTCEAAGDRDAEEGEEINRSNTKMQTKGLKESGKELREEKKGSYCKQVEPQADLAKALSFPTADSITFSCV